MQKNKKASKRVFSLLVVVALAIACTPVNPVLAAGPLHAYAQLVTSTNGLDTVIEEFAASGELFDDEVIDLAQPHYAPDLSIRFHLYGIAVAIDEESYVELDGVQVPVASSDITGFHGASSCTDRLAGLDALLAPGATHSTIGSDMPAVSSARSKSIGSPRPQ